MDRRNSHFYKLNPIHWHSLWICSEFSYHRMKKSFLFLQKKKLEQRFKFPSSQPVASLFISCTAASRSCKNYASKLELNKMPRNLRKISGVNKFLIRCLGNAHVSISFRMKCEYMKGFMPKFQSNWDMADWSNGCIPSIPLDCLKDL